MSQEFSQLYFSTTYIQLSSSAVYAKLYKTVFYLLICVFILSQDSDEALYELA